MDLDALKNPGAAFRPWPLFVLNADYDCEEGLDTLYGGLAALKSVGFGGVFLHPRPGLITEYLSDRWFSVIEALIEHCAALELEVALYDENSYPSGSGGGHVCAQRPETRALSVQPCFGRGLDLPPRCLALYAWDGSRPQEKLEPLELSPEIDWVAFCETEAMVLDWHGQVAVPSLLDPLTAPAFLKCTHDAYWEKLSPKARSSVVAMFTDEPHLVSDSHGIEGRGLQITPYFRARFREVYGYPLESYLAGLFFNTPESGGVRYDFFDLCHRLWDESWAEPLYRWHREHGWNLTGHYLEHDWPVPFATPGQMELLAKMDWPGTDQLLGFALEGHDFHDIQNYGPAKPGQEPHLLYTLRQAHSVANQFGKERVINECWGAGSHASTPTDWLRIGQFLIVNGVNLLVPHHAMTSICGTRKHDHPQFFSPQSPWFHRLRPFNDRLGRLCYAMSQGKVCNRILVLDAQTSAYTLAEKGRWSIKSISLQSSIERQGMLAKLRDEAVWFVQSLAEAQVDFDLGDEYLLGKEGGTQGGSLDLGEQSYELVVFPPGLCNLRGETERLLERYLERGGKIGGVRPANLQISGRPANTLREWGERFPENLCWTTEANALESIVSAVPPRVRLLNAGAGMYHQRRVTDGGILWLLLNCSLEDLQLALPENGSWVEVDLESGSTHAVEITDLNALTLDSGEARLLVQVSRKNGAAKPRQSSGVFWVVRSQDHRGGPTLDPVSVQASDPNVLVLDRCRLRMDEQDYHPLDTTKVNSLIWLRHGLSSFGWSRTVQYRRQVLDRAETLSGSGGYSVCYDFHIGPDFMPESICLAVEQPQRFQVALNGRAIDFSEGRRWLDPAIRAQAIFPMLRRGANTVELRQLRFDPRAEIAPVYLIGDFGVVPTETGFQIVEEVPLGLGSWRTCGRLFYDREVTYVFSPLEPGRFTIAGRSWKGSWLSVSCPQGTFQCYPGHGVSLELSSPALVEVTVTGLPWNLLGPWHGVDDGMRKFSSPTHWNELIDAGLRPGWDYNLIDLGLLEPPIFSAGGGG